ncbi:MAG: SLBB domain-containing protein, partial [Steroidobacteraceae bacterium]
MIGLVFTAPLARAQMPSGEQLLMLQDLSSEQRSAILDRVMGNQRSGSDSSSSAVERSGTQSKRIDSRRRAARDGDETGELTQPLDPRLQRPPTFKAEDWLLIEIGFASPPKPELIVPAGAPAGTPPVVVPSLEPDKDDVLKEDEKKRLEELVQLIRSRNPYQLDRLGALQLPGYPAIPLAGLNEEQATLRLMAEPSFRRLELNITRLPLSRLGLAGLKPFGYDLFDEDPSIFAPVTDVPVPSDYIVGSGDQLTIQLYGSQNRNLRLTVERDGRISFPELGPIMVGGRRFESVRADIESRVQEQMIGVRAAVSMGDTRTIRVFVLGEVKYPGSYAISGLGTVTTALFASGGIKSIGSLRDIQVKRGGTIVRRIDLYDLLLRGDTSNDVKLQSGDVIFIPPVGPTVSVEGEVRRPAIYELRGDAPIDDVVQLAGGLTPEADGARIAVSRIDERRRRVVVDVDLGTPVGRTTMLRNGDVLRIDRVRPQLDSGVVLQGHVHSPGVVAWRSDLRLSDVIPSVDYLKPNADLGYVLIRRELPPDRRIVVVSADLARALREPGGEADLRLSTRDQITVFDLESSREREISRLLDEIRLQARFGSPTSIVRIGGRVKLPGEYPLEMNMTVSDLVRAGGNLSDAAYGGKAELARYSVVDGEARRTELIEIDLAKALAGDAEADIALRPFDYLSVKEIPEWTVQEEVVLKGEVRFPGTYPVKRGETLRSLLARAGGLTELAFPEGAVFTREELREREQKQLDSLTQRLQTDIATMSLAAAAANQQGAAQASNVGQSLLTQLKSAKAVGRLVIDLDRVVASNAAGTAGDIVLRDGDQLLIPKRSQEVTVIGEVQNSTSHLFQPGLSRGDYVALSGGTTRRADDRRIYVVRASGSVVS